MTDPEKRKPKTPRARGSAGAGAVTDDLRYSIELWNGKRTEVERVLGRAINISLARAIFLAAQEEHTGRFITLRHEGQIVAQSR